MKMAKNKKCFQIQFDSYTFDEAVELTGYGRFHYKVVSICALCILSVGLENGLSSFVFPFAQCDLNINSSDVGLINIAFLLGGTCSGFMWGIIADLNGRKNVLIMTMLINSLITILCSFMTTFTGILVCRFLNGFFVGCPASVSFTYLAEFHPPKYRAKSVCFSGIFFISAWLILPMIAYFILPIQFDNLSSEFEYRSWRLFLVVLAVPQLVATVCLLFLPESPKFLVHKACVDEALDILKEIYCKNSGKNVENYPVKKLQCDMMYIESCKLRCQGKVTTILKNMFGQLRKIFCPPLRKVTYILCIVTFCNMFGYFGLGLWLPEFFMSFDRHEQLHPNRTIGITDISFQKERLVGLICKTTFSEKTLKNTLIVATSAVITMVVSGSLTEKISLKTLTFVTMFIGSLSSACIYWVRSSTDILILSSVFQSAMTTANMVLGSIIVELFPTMVSAVAYSVILCAGRIGAICSNMLFSLFINLHVDVILFVGSGVIFVGAVFCIFITFQSKLLESEETDKNRQIEVSVVPLNDGCDVIATTL